MIFDIRKITALSIFLFFIFIPVYSFSQNKEIPAEKTGINTQDTRAEENKGETSDKDQAVKKENIKLKPLIIKGEKDKKKKKKDIQVISRQTMTRQEMKEVPASFGDSVTALTALPGIIRAGGGIFGPLVIRGADMTTNRYYIDDVPINDPLHFGGLHCVINTNLIDDIDVYSSAFPAEFGSATSAIINITTVDKVDRFSGYTDIGLLSVAALVQTPVLRSKDTGELKFDGPSDLKSPDNMENAGYAIVSGRYGYLTLGIKLAELITGNKIPVSPEYWDYQAKCKYIFDSSNSVTLFFFGHKDFIRVLIKKSFLEEGDDPYFANTQFQSDKLSHSQAAYYDFTPSKKLNLRTVAYNTLPETYSYINFGSEGVASWAKDVHMSSRPNVFGVKEKAKMKWLDDHAEARGALEYTLFYFQVDGKSLYATKQEEDINLGDENAAKTFYINQNIYNNLFGGYIENKFTFGGFTALPGIRSEYLRRAETATFDPRLMMSYKFPTDTTISVAGGKYSYFFQTNPYIFDSNPDVSKIGTKLKPEKAVHSALGVEQGIDLFTVKMEGFDNYFYDKPIGYPHYEPDGTYLQGLSSLKIKAYGFELMLKKDTRENQNGLYGWFSYTYTHSMQKTGLPTKDGLYGLKDNNGEYLNKAGDDYGDKWTTSYYEQRHCLKFVAGYKLDNHIFSGRFQYYTSMPFTPIVDNEHYSVYDPNVGHDVPIDYDPYYYALTHKYRYVPVYGKTNSSHYPPACILDLRYTYKENHSWGYVSWYVEVINILSVWVNNEYDYKWYYNKPYEKGSNPEMKVNNQGLSFLPNFGVELKF